VSISSKIYKTFKAIGLIIKNPWLLNILLEEETNWQRQVARRYGPASRLPVLSADELFGDFTETVDPFAFLNGGSLPTDLALLKKLAKKIGKQCSYFEIGTWRGESVANVASVAEICYTLNLSGEEMAAKGLNQKYIDLHRYYSKNIANIIHLEGNTRTWDFTSLNRKFDLVFIDGDHHYDMVKQDTQKVFSHLVHENSIVVWHDYAHDPETVRYEVLAAILDGSPENAHDHLFHVANTLCAVYLPGITGGTRPETPLEPSGAYKVDIQYKRKN